MLDKLVRAVQSLGMEATPLDGVAVTTAGAATAAKKVRVGWVPGWLPRWRR